MDVADLKEIYRSFRESLPAAQRDDRYFKIFYSPIRRAPLAIVGLNPGGDPHREKPFQAGSKFFENNEHDYVDCHYPLARKTRELLLESGIVPDESGIRAIPKFNVLFHRSRNIGLLEREKDARELARPHVAAMLRDISPKVMLFEGVRALKHLVRQQELETDDHGSLVENHIVTMNLSGGPLTRPCHAICLRHPTGYRWSRSKWTAAIGEVGRIWSRMMF